MSSLERLIDSRSQACESVLGVCKDELASDELVSSVMNCSSCKRKPGDHICPYCAAEVRSLYNFLRDHV